MDTLIVPPSPNWYQPDIMACAPDNTFLYGARNDFVVIKPTFDDRPDDIQIVSKAHFKWIVSVNINKNWGKPHKYAVTTSEDKVVKLWDVESVTKKGAHNKHLHLDEETKMVGANFAGDDRVISVVDKGTIIIWNISTNETGVLNSLFGVHKVTITCFSVCPHITWLAAFGMSKGLIVIADLRNTGSIVHNLRGHTHSVVSFAWCPAPVNIAPQNKNNAIREKKLDSSPDQPSDSTNCIAILQDVSEDSGETVSVNFAKEQDETEKNEVLIAEEQMQVLQVDNYEARDNVPEETTMSCERSQPKENDEEGSPITENDSSIASRMSMNLIPEPSTPETESNSIEGNLISERSEKFKASINPENNVSDTEEPLQTLAPVESWRIKPMSIVEEPRREFLLASSAREDQICIWRAGTDGTCQQFLKVAKSNQSKRYKSKDKEKIWIVLCWPVPTVLLSSSRAGEVLMWPLPNPYSSSKEDGKTHFSKLHGKHTILMALKAPVHYCNEYNFLQERNINVWSCGQERNLCNYDVPSKEMKNFYHTFAARINCIAASPLDPCRLAIGGDERFSYIKIWNLGQPNKKLVQFISINEQIHASVTALAWHPGDENLLAWATVEGRIGVTSVNNKSSIVLRNHFTSEVYKIEWGPNDEALGCRKLFAVSQGVVAAFHAKKEQGVFKSQLVDVTDLQRAAVYTFAWKPDYSFAMVTSKAGTCFKVSANLKEVQSFYRSSRLDCIVWHPHAASSTLTKYSNMFVGVERGTTIVVFDFKKNEQCHSDMLNECVQFDTLIGGRVQAIQWSPHDDHIFVAANETGVAQVYDINEACVVHTYMNPWLDPFTSVCWSPIDANYIILGTEQRKIIVVKITDFPPLKYDEINIRRKRMDKLQRNEFVAHLLKEKKSKVEEDVEVHPQKKSLLLPNFYIMKESRLTSDIEKLLNWKLGNKELEGSSGDNCHIDILDIFGTKKGMERVIEINLTSFYQSGLYDRTNKLSLCNGDIQKVIKDAIEGKRVDLWTIAMAPMVSFDLWKAACDTMIEQLANSVTEVDPFLMMSLLLARHQPGKAVTFLCEKKMFREAYALAKLRFGEDSEEVADTLLQWAKNCYAEGNYEFAACCYIYLGQFEEAALGLSRRSSTDRLELTLKLANLCDNVELQRDIAIKLNQAKITDNVQATADTECEGVPEENEDLNDEQYILPADCTFQDDKTDKACVESTSSS
ncbi:gem-associated protein 5 isoform X2 [Euwallacea fornicatus]|uniref:gem-associated protein 5 isoform X2 n=1 Tax=Euwallacea fornicatus TaxID=995702 RepID=UPI0033900500